jgi:serine phosphatase RsbU (regulator of sigma subunit)
VVLAAVVAIDLLNGRGQALVGLLVMPPLLAATALGRRATLGYGLLALLAAALMGGYAGLWSSGFVTQSIRLVGVVLATALALSACTLRVHRDERLDQLRRQAAANEAALQMAEALQRSLLTEPPEPDHAEIVVRYLPAAEAARVGGDWYDAFLQPSGATTLVIGDVVGHDTAAAAAMGQVRSLLRGIAAYSDAGPAEVLRGLDSAMAVLQIDTLATAAVARFEQDEEDRRRGVTRMVWANAGHLPPLALRPDGSVVVLADWKADLLLGVDSSVHRTELEVTLDRGSTVLLYTDGLIERRDADLDTGLQRLRTHLAELADLPLQQLCDELLARLVDGKPEDDVALVAVRLHREDRPRPVEAGPNRVPDVVPEDPTLG